jgi:hypothetical protein
MSSASLPRLYIGHVTADSGKQAIREWLFTEMSKDQAEELLKEHLHQFASLELEWESLKRMVQEGEELWLWGVPHTCKRYYPTVGYSIVRGGNVVATLALPQHTSVDVIAGLSEQASRDWLEERVAVDEVVGKLKDGGLSRSVERNEAANG